MNDVKVSVIIPACNTELYIGDMIECLLNQTYRNIRMILNYDGSSDKTEDIINNYKINSIEYYCQETNEY